MTKNANILNHHIENIWLNQVEPYYEKSCSCERMMLSKQLVLYEIT